MKDTCSVNNACRYFSLFILQEAFRITAGMFLCGCKQTLSYGFIPTFRTLS